MFPKRERLLRSQFGSALKSGRRVSSPHFTIIVPQKTKGYAVVLSKKTAHLSTTRHRIKRRVIEALRALPLPQALILFPKSSVLHLSQHHIQAELGSLLSKIQQ